MARCWESVTVLKTEDLEKIPKVVALERSLALYKRIYDEALVIPAGRQFSLAAQKHKHWDSVWGNGHQVWYCACCHYVGRRRGGVNPQALCAQCPALKLWGNELDTSKMIPPCERKGSPFAAVSAARFVYQVIEPLKTMVDFFTEALAGARREATPVTATEVISFIMTLPVYPTMSPERYERVMGYLKAKEAEEAERPTPE